NITLANPGTVDDDTTNTTALVLNGGTNGTITLNGAVGDSMPIAALSATGATIDLNGGNITTAGNQTYNASVSLTANTTLASTGSGDITFASTVDGAFTLAVNTGGNTSFGGAVGNGTALISLTTDAAGNTAINGGAVKTSGDQSYGDAVVLGANTTLT